MRYHALAGLGLLSVASAQYSNFDPNQVSPDEKNSWCTDQQNSCVLLCGGEEKCSNNGCDHTTLDWACICTDDSQPAMEKYVKTIPTYECNWEKNTDCGSLDPAQANQEATTTSSQSTSTTTTAPTATGTKTGKGSAVVSSSTTETGTPTSSPTSSSQPDTSSSGGVSTAAAAAIGIVAAVAIIALVALLFFQLGRRRNGSKGDKLDDYGEREGSHRFEKMGPDASSSQIFEMSSTRPPMELDSRPSPSLPPVSRARTPEPVELDSRMMPLDIKIEGSENENTKYRFS